MGCGFDCLIPLAKGRGEGYLHPRLGFPMRRYSVMRRQPIGLSGNRL